MGLIIKTFRALSLAVVLLSAASCGVVVQDVPLVSTLSYCASHSADAPFAGGDGSIATPYLICTGTQLAAMQGATGYFTMMQDIDYSTQTYLGSITISTATVLDGGGYKLKNLTNGASYFGFFLISTSGGAHVEIKNLTVENVTVAATSFGIGFLIGLSSITDSNLTVDNITIKNCTLTSTNTSHGGLAGQLMISDNSTINISNIVVDGLSITSSQAQQGGVIGRVSLLSGAPTFSLSNATVSNSTITGTGVSGSSIGGIIGITSGVSTYSFSNLVSSATVSGRDYVGGLAGQANVTTAGGNLGITTSYATGNVTGYTRVGGLIGRTSGPSAAQVQISQSYYAGGTVTSSADNLHGTGGLIGNASGVTIQTSFSKGTVNSTAGGYPVVGGLVGYATTTNITNSYSIATVNGTNAAMSGGFIGLHASGAITRSYSAGLVSATGGDNTGFVGSTGIVSTESAYDSDTSTQGSGGISAPNTFSFAAMGVEASFTAINWVFPTPWIMPLTATCTNYNYHGPALAGVTPGC